LNAAFSIKDGRNKFAGHLKGFAANGTIAFSFPIGSIEGWSHAKFSVRSKSLPDEESTVVGTYGDSTLDGDFGFEFNSEVNLGGFGVCWFHKVVVADYPSFLSQMPLLVHRK